MGASIVERNPSLPFTPRHLSVHFPPCPCHLLARPDGHLSLCPLPASTVTCIHRHARIHRSTLQTTEPMQLSQEVHLLLLIYVL